MSYVVKDGSLGAYYPTQPAEDNGVGSLGYPLYVNGHLFQEPVTISHVPGAAAGFGDAQDDAAAAAEAKLALRNMYGTLAALAAAISVYHGYARNNSAGWALAWGAFGAVLPIVALPIAMAQGFGEKKRK